MTSELSNRTRRTPSDDEIPALLEALATSGGTVASLARERGLAPWKLYEARRVATTGRRRRRPQREVDLMEVQVVKDRPTLSVPFELVLCSGQRLLIPAGFDETALRSLLGVLASC